LQSVCDDSGRTQEGEPATEIQSESVDRILGRVQLDKCLQNLEPCDKVIITRDMIFNEQETSNGDLAALKDDMLRSINPDELSELLQKCAISNESDEEQVQPA
jgi:hypothetical protein